VLGVLLRETGNLDGARACFESILLMEPDAATAHYDIAAILAAQRQPNEACARFMRGVNVAPDRAEALASYASLLLQMGRLKEAKQRLDEAFALSPDHPAPHQIMGELLLRQDSPEEAIAHYEAAARARPSLAPEINERIARLRK
jgi:tetratricopeptide (TPR) repeat protein